MKIWKDLTMDQSKTLFFRSKEQELEHLIEFKEIYLTYLGNKEKEFKRIDEKEKEIEEHKDRIDFYSNPWRYYGKKTDFFDTLRAVARVFIIISIIATFITSIIGVFPMILGAIGASSGEVGGIFGGAAVVITSIVITSVIFLISAVVLIVCIFIVVFFTKKYRVARKFKRDKSTREVNIQSLNAAIEKARQEIEACEMRIKALEDEFYSVPTILHVCDYEYIEYIIFLYEAGRADNLRQAVVILDQEKRNYQLLQKMEEVNYRIKEAANTISTRVSGAINTMSARISRELEISRDQMRSQMNTMNAQMAISNTLAASQLSQLRGIKSNTHNINSNISGLRTSLSEGIRVYGVY